MEAVIPILTLLAILLAPPPHPYWHLDETSGPTVALSGRFTPPLGFARVPVDVGGFAHFLRDLPLSPDRTNVLAFDGERLSRPAAAIVALDVGDRDLQQCADSAIRLHAEWLFATGRGQQAAYHFTSGDRTTFADFVSGETFIAVGRGVQRRQGIARRADHPSFRRWLNLVFGYAGSRSLRLDTTAVPTDADLRAGDLFVQGGSPGHVVVLLDIAQHPDGRRVALIGQGFMPAEDFHVLRGTTDAAIDGVWFNLPGPGGSLQTPSWRPFERGDARRFRQH
ncbi:MAG: hypothetical protein EXR76_06705 [Myxococcales bacterium]|nr:hypothetical protein [Myxococcales bacterium]